MLLVEILLSETTKTLVHDRKITCAGHMAEIIFLISTEMWINSTQHRTAYS